MTTEPQDVIVNVVFKAPVRMANAIHRAAARRLLSRADYIRQSLLQQLQDDGVDLERPETRAA